MKPKTDQEWLDEAESTGETRWIEYGVKHACCRFCGDCYLCGPCYCEIKDEVLH